MRAYAIIKLMAVAGLTMALNAGCVAISVGGSAGGPGPVPPGGGLRRTAAPQDAAEANAVVQRSLKDVERFWTAAYPKLADGRPFEPVRGGYHPYTRSDPPPACSGDVLEYQPNAFYCPPGDFIAWDAETLIPELHSNFGPLLVAVVMAHEYGHAVQAKLRQSRQPTIVLEQQADCYAGAWVGDVLAGRSEPFRDITAKQLDSAVAGMLQLRDQPGTSAENPQAHGNAFDRVRAFQEGVEQSAPRCATYRSDNLPVTQVPFKTERDAATGGNLPYADAIRLLSEDVQKYWARTYPQLTGQQWRTLPVHTFDPAEPPECEGHIHPPDAGATAFYCTSGDYVAFDDQQLGPALHEEIGDNALGMLLGNLFAQAVQQRRGQSTEGREGQLAVDCLAGSWTYDLLHRTETDVELSPGDLDEAVTALLVFGRSEQSGGISAFERIAGFRKGVLQGLPACR